METEKSKVKTLIKVIKVLFIGIASFVFIISILNWIWISSGSNRWNLRYDKDEIKVFTLKSPGSPVPKIKVIAPFKGGFTLSQFVAALIDDDSGEDCQEWIPGCTGIKQIQEWNPKALSDAHVMTLKLFFPFSPREFMYKSQVFQDPNTKVVRIDIISAPNLAKPTDGFVRLTHFHNVWHYTPCENGDIITEVIYDVDLGGLFPGLMSIMMVMNCEKNAKFLSTQLPGLVSKDKYRNAKYDFIEEL